MNRTPPEFEPQLERLRRRFWNRHFVCPCDTQTYFCRPCSSRYNALYDGAEHYVKVSPAMAGAFRRGSEAWAAGVDRYANPYRRETKRTDRRGRYNAGFRPAFENAWEAGWAWGQWLDPAEMALRSLGRAPEDFYDPDQSPEDRAKARARTARDRERSETATAQAVALGKR